MKNKISYPDDLEAIIEQKLAEINDRRSLISTERTDVHLYYNQKLPPARPGGSTYVASSVRDSVSAMKALLTKAFCGKSDVAGFSPTHIGDTGEAARVATEVTKQVVFKENEGHRIFGTWFDDALKARVGIIKVWWNEEYEYSDHTFKGINTNALHGLNVQDEITDLEFSDDQDDMGMPTGTITGSLTRKIDRSNVKIDNVPPEEFFISPQARCLEKSFHGHRIMVTKAEMAEMGLDIDLLENAKPDADGLMSTDYEANARNIRLDTILSHNDPTMREEDQLFYLYECYLHMTSPEGRPALYKVIKVADVIMAFDEVDRSPFIDFTPLPIAHSFEGENFATLSIPTQNIYSMLMRAIVDNTASAVNNKWLVENGALKNPDELLSELTRIVNTKQGGNQAIMPAPIQQLNPAIPGLMQTIKADNEERTGISALSLGLSEEVLSNQNSALMVDQQVNLSQIRLEAIAKEFAEHSLKRLFLEVYRLIIENEPDIRRQSIEIAGNYVPINPQTWIERKDADVYLHLSPDDSAKEAADFLTMMAAFKQDPDLQNCITPQNTFNAAVKVARLKGYTDIASFLTTPDQAPPPPPNPLMMAQQAQLQLAQKEVAIKEMEANARIQKQQQDFELEKMRLQIQMEQLELKKQTSISEMERKLMVSASNIDTEQREMTLLENSPPPQNLTAIANPHPST